MKGIGSGHAYYLLCWVGKHGGHQRYGNQSRTGDESFEIAFTIGRKMPVEAAVALALKLE